ncbi:d-3-phosphoglycerate dehydrogenase protein [Penicillium lagena]|uniref:d-3-phosphoglycerate dehydrogenase protein n=1 Tax=Penicillium lagena TaxID=94218 RepID=UPI002540D42E|nr:d-3-phosphoglycerate dehydrogenase protein [Penicillium lagena]KAJ5605692.1 d-3-phosphoglycerate dehydrogenase protein [Penicillium lagena]
MAKPTVYVLDPYHEDAIACLKSTSWIELILPNDPRKADWHNHADGIILRSETQLQADDFRRAKKLRVVVKQGVGVDNIDLNAAKEAGIAVHNTPALNSESVAEFSLALALSLSRRVAEVDRRVRNGDRIVRSQTLGLSLFRKTVGVVGMGNIGKVAAKKWIGACEADVIGFDPVAPVNVWNQAEIPHTRVQTLDELITKSDVITLHVPLLESTRGLITARELGMMKDRAILINAARGGIVDEKALLDALKEKRIWGAVLDAMEVEPPTLEAYGDFLELDNVIMTPHIGASTIENQSNSGLAVVKTLLAVLEGKTDDVPGKLV